jgi:hypothetical protein
MDAARRQPVSPPLFYGFAVASIGGPLALAVIYVPGAADMRAAGLVTVVGAFLYAAPLSVWLRFSRDVVSPAGLAGFVEAAAGPPARGREPHDPPRSARRRADRRRVPGGFTAPFAFTGVPVRRVLRGIAVPFIALGALTIINPEWFDEHVLRPSLIALYCRS